MNKTITTLFLAAGLLAFAPSCSKAEKGSKKANTLAKKKIRKEAEDVTVAGGGKYGVPGSFVEEEDALGCITQPGWDLKTSSCGSIKPKLVSFSENKDKPASFKVGEVISFETNTPMELNEARHKDELFLDTYWTVDLKPGKYRLVGDWAEGPTHERWPQSLGVHFYNHSKKLFSYGQSVDNDSNVLGRGAWAFEVKANTKVLIKIAPGQKQLTTFGVFDDSMAVPSPFFTACDAVEELKVGETQKFLIRGGKRGNEHFNLPTQLEFKGGPGKYKIATRLEARENWAFNAKNEFRTMAGVGADDSCKGYREGYYRTKEIEVNKANVDEFEFSVASEGTHWVHVLNSTHLGDYERKKNGLYLEATITGPL